MPYNIDNEKEVLDYWFKNKIFEKSVSERPEDKPYIFYDGPPFATGLPHYGHIVASTMKDIVPRYWTMKGYRVERRWGWDCHGLPIENIVEKELNLNTRQDIVEMGIDKFNETCRTKVLTYAEEWKKTIKRIGRWVDMENSYKTMDLDFMESVWWVFKELWDKGLIYEGKKPMHICPHCVTPLSNFEVTQGYKEIKDITATVKFKLKTDFGLKEPVYILAWTTTPWTLPGNVLLAIGEDIEYILVKIKDLTGYYVLAKDLQESVLKDLDYDVIKELSASDLDNLNYEPLFPYFKDTENAFRIVKADFVTTDEGTGIVHIAPAFGEDDFYLGQREKVAWVQHVKMNGQFTDDVSDFAGLEVKPKDNPSQTDIEIIKYLAKHDLLFKKEKHTHSYPHCWRCDTPLLNYATSSWFVKVTDLKEQMLKNNEKINWIPEHIKYGRFGKWLEGARDWAISRNRFWGSALPIWRSEDGETICVGSVKELEELSGEKVTDLHKHIIDKIIIKKDGKEFKRIPDVLDCWFESGAMPYGQMHYPFENKEKFEAGFPAQFIAEGQDQTRGWFYTLHVLATALTKQPQPAIPVSESGPAFLNVIVNGIVLAEDGKKMSKRLKNFPDPNLILDKYGADALRYYLLSSPVMHAENLNFSEAGVREVFNKLINTLWNVYTFYNMFSVEIENKDIDVDKHVLDIWIIERLKLLLNQVTDNMDKYRLAEASRPILDFVTELSQWYVRRSRARFKSSDLKIKLPALQTLHDILLILSKIIAPFTPFIAEKIYLNLKQRAVNNRDLYKESVHLESWPEKVDYDENILKQMDVVRKIVEIGLSLRKENNLKVRQPLNSLLIIKNTKTQTLNGQLLSIIADELNVEKVDIVESIDDQAFAYKEDGELKVGLDINVSPELREKGLKREVIRTINQWRKEQKLTIADKIVIKYFSEDKELLDLIGKFKTEIEEQTLSELELVEQLDGEEKKVDSFKLKLVK